MTSLSAATFTVLTRFARTSPPDLGLRKLATPATLHHWPYLSPPTLCQVDGITSTSSV